MIMMERGGWAYLVEALHYISFVNQRISGCGIPHTFQKQKEHHIICYGKVQHYAAISRC